jgi:hypothetical protein
VFVSFSSRDAKLLTDGFSFFKASDVQISLGEANARIESPEFDYNLRTSRSVQIPPALGSGRRDAAIANSRARYATARSVVEASLAEHEKPKRESGLSTDKNETSRTCRLTRKSRLVPPLRRGGPEHKYLQSLIRRRGSRRRTSITRF